MIAYNTLPFYLGGEKIVLPWLLTNFFLIQHFWYPVLDFASLFGFSLRKSTVGR